jgi:hypothetical protein
LFTFLFTGCNSLSKNKDEKQQKEVESDEESYNSLSKNNDEKQNSILINDFEYNLSMDTSAFVKIISKIDTLKIPVTFYCGAESSPWAEDLGVDIAAIAPENSMIVGLLPIKSNYIYIIYAFAGDILYPYLYTYNRNGYLIDSLYLHIRYCVGDESEIITNTTTINADYSIEMSDKTQYIHYINNDTRIEDSIVVKKRTLKLGVDNLFAIIKEEERKE